MVMGSRNSSSVTRIEALGIRINELTLSVNGGKLNKEVAQKNHGELMSELDTLLCNASSEEKVLLEEVEEQLVHLQGMIEAPAEDNDESW